MPQFIEAEPYPWPHDGALRPATTALLVIDMQRDFCDPQGYFAASGNDSTAASALIPIVGQLCRKLRAWGATVIYTREGHRPDLSDLPALKAWRSRRAGIGIGAAGPLGRLLVRGQPGWNIVPALAPEPADIIIDKPGYSAFFATDLERILRACGIEKLIFCGVTTDICVHSTLRSAVERGFECLVVGDACAASDPANHAASLRTITTEGGIFGAVTGIEQVSRYFFEKK